MTGNGQKIIEWLFNQERDKVFEIKEYKPKRSRNSNSYAWELLTQIANTVRKSKEEVYLDMLKHYGQSEIVSMLSSINPSGYFKYYELIGTGKVNGKDFNHYKIFKGSSEFDSKEMSIFLDGIIQEAENLGIPTLTSVEIERLGL